MSTKTGIVFPYFWYLDERNKEVTVIRVYCLDQNNKVICLMINDFTPYIYLELPKKTNGGSDITWDERKAQKLSDKIVTRCGSHRPIKTSFLHKKKLYYCQRFASNLQKETMFPFLLLAFSSTEDRKRFVWKVSGKSFDVMGMGKITVKAHEQDANPILQLACHRKIPMAGWIKFRGKQVREGDRITLCDEYVVRWKNLTFEGGDTVPSPLILSMDIEVYSSNPNRMPQASIPSDKVFQISCVLKRNGGTKETKFLLTLGTPTPRLVGKDVTILNFNTEADLLCGYAEFLQKYQPNIVTGYNILGFDIPYMIERAKHNMVIDVFRRLGFPKYLPAEERQIKWSSSAYKVQRFEFLDAEGILHVDLLPLIKRDYKFSNYKLKTVSEFFVGQTKDPLTHKGIFKCYEMGMKGGEKGNKALAVCGKYCVQDSALVTKLFEVLQTWVGLCEMAKVCNVPIFYLYTQGQQIKVYSQVYKKCMYENRVVQHEGYVTQSNEYYTGAYVFEPKPGVYNQVVPFDFSSLYPTTMIAYNIDFSTLVRDSSDIPDSMCNIIEWEDFAGIDKKGERVAVGYDFESVASKPKVKKVESVHRRYRFIKSPQGVLPNLLQNLLDARSATKKEMKAGKKKYAAMTEKEKGSADGKALAKLIVVLNKRQLAFKVSANSMYGAMGVRRGYLPFIPGAMCTTAWGRMNIQRAAERLQSVHGGELIYGDTDSNYIHFPQAEYNNAQKLWDHCLEVEEDISSIFPQPMRMAFEEVIYWKFLILTKKRYMYLDCGRDGKVSTKVGKKGVLLARRDNSPFIRLIYEEVVQMIFDEKTWEEVHYHLCCRFNNLCSGFFGHKEFVITKSVGEVADYACMQSNKLAGFDEKTNTKGVPNGWKKRIKQLQEKEIKCHDCDYKNIPSEESIVKCSEVLEKYVAQAFVQFTEAEETILNRKLNGACPFCALEEWRMRKKALPAQIQLAEKMRRRGQRVDAGSRLEYLVCDYGTIKDRVAEKLEDPAYFVSHRGIIKIEYLYYLKLLANSMDQLVEVAYKQKSFTMQQFKARIKYSEVCQQIKKLGMPNIELLMDLEDLIQLSN